MDAERPIVPLKEKGAARPRIGYVLMYGASRGEIRTRSRDTRYAFARSLARDVRRRESTVC